MSNHSTSNEYFTIGTWHRTNNRRSYSCSTTERTIGSMRSALLACLLLSSTALCASSKRPNFLVLFADDMGYGDMSCTGHPTLKTPNIDRLAADGMRFTQWYSAFHVCSPSRAAMLTGRLPIRSGTVGQGWTGGVFRSDAVGGLPRNETTFASLLQSAGYRTGMIGKWHLGQREEFMPTSHGFEEYYGIPYSVDMGASAWDAAGGNPTPLPLVRNLTVVEQPVDLDTLTDRYANEAVEFFKRNKDEDWVMYLSWGHMHVPNFANKVHCNQTRRGRYGDAILEMDSGFGTVLEGLHSLGLEENTIVFFTSDNGPWLTKEIQGGSAGHLRDGKETTWEGGVRVPGIVRWTGHVAAGQINQEVVATYDIFSTMLAQAGVEEPKDRVIDGRDMTDILLHPGKSKTHHECVFIYKGHPEGPDKPGLWAIRCGAYKLHYFTSNWENPTDAVKHDPPLLFQIENDPSERYPVDPLSGVYQAQRAIIEAAKSAHEKTVEDVPNQMALGSDPTYALCCDPNSSKKHPQFMNCTCNPHNWNAFVCAPLDPTYQF